MPTFSEVLDLAHTASEALNSLEESAKSRVLSLFAGYENGVVDYGDLRVALLRQANTGFLAAGSVATEHIKSIAESEGIEGLELSVLTSAPVLEHLLRDIRTNLETFRDSDRSSTDLRRLRFRSGLSVQAAVRRGFTENQLAAGEAIQKKGALLRKVWLANFSNHTPCDTCLSLHGTEMDLHEEFPHGGDKSPKVYEGLQGPPRHPNCHCYMLVYVVTLEKTAQIPLAPVVAEEKFMSSLDVRRLPRAVFTAAVTTLRLIAGKLKGVFRGKR